MRDKRLSRAVSLPLLFVSGIAMAQMSPAEPLMSPSPSLASISPVRAPDNDLERMLMRLDHEEKSIASELDRMKSDLEVTRRRMLARGRTYYRYVRAGLLPVGSGFEGLVDHAARVERMLQALERDIANESRLVKESGSLEERLLRVRAERAPLEVQREAMQRARSALAQADERRDAFARAFESSSRPPDYLAIYGAEGPVDADSNGGFRALRGRLAFPVAGRTEVRKVHRRGAGGPGLELNATGASGARTVAAGRIVFADRYDEYGLTVIVDHGDHYYSVYAGLETADVRVGDNIASGARIGSIAASANGRPVLYFELRKGADTVDPGPWFGL